LGLLFAAGCGSSDPEVAPDQARALPVALLTVNSEPGARAQRRVSGLVEPARSADLGFEIAGRLATVWVEEGATVEAGKELAALDTERLRVREKEAASALAEAEAELALAKRTAERIEAAREREAVSARDLDEARRRVEGLVARVERLKAAREAVRVDLRKSVLSAPFSGKISGRYADDGEVLSAGTPVLRLIETERKEIRLGLPENAVANFAEGEERVFLVNSRELIARLEAVLPNRSGDTRTVELRFVFEDRQDRIRVGTLATTEIKEELHGEGFWIPQTALTDNLRGLWAAYIAVPRDGDEAALVAERIDLEVHWIEGNRVFVRGGLREGDRLVRNGVHRLVPGMRVVATEETGS
jgi:RND family efflux transporter MFP subunit